MHAAAKYTVIYLDEELRSAADILLFRLSGLLTSES